MLPHFRLLVFFLFFTPRLLSGAYRSKKEGGADGFTG